jgi:ergothioneine biosynthesis protein EgtB
MLELLATQLDDELARRIEVGLHHEQQHQELLITDVKHLLSCNPLDPAYLDARADSGAATSAPAMRWSSHHGGIVHIGCEDERFHFDNEGPVHDALVHPFELGQRLVTNEEYLAFIDDDGYRRSELWLSAGWDAVREQGWSAPQYWRKNAERWSTFTLRGRRALQGHEPVVHVSYYEADAYARWSGARLPTEQEWEVATAEPEPEPLCGRAPSLNPTVPSPYGAAWQWTSSSYAAYPGYHSAEGALG